MKNKNNIDLENYRIKGKFWTKRITSQKAYKIITKYIQPDCIIEPFAGEGNLIDDFKLNHNCNIIVNDIDAEALSLLRKKYSNNLQLTIFSNDVITMPINTLLLEWNMSNFNQKQSFLVYSNPPFGTSNTSKMASRNIERERNEKNNHKSRCISIQYGADGAEDKWFGDTYGRGDLCIPAIAHMIEMIKRRGNGYLAFFSPFGVLLGRKRFEKLLHALLKDFEFLHGEIFSGKDFENVASQKPIAFSLWKYSPNCQTQHESLQFKYEEQILHLKKLPLLKEFWEPDNRKKIHGEVCVQCNRSFSDVIPKIIHDNIDKGGTEIVSENVKKQILIPFIPSEILFGLWTLTVGRRGIVEPPIYFLESYTHLPDFTKPETIEILAYTALFTIITELKNNLCHNKIGFNQNNEIIFGQSLLTQNINWLLSTYEHLNVNDLIIDVIIKKLQHNHNPDLITPKLRIYIRNEISTRLNQINYWNFIPIS